MRIGILGGTFDPPHNAHVALAQAARTALRLDRLLVVPSGNPPYKICHAAPQDRFDMASAAFSDVPDAEISRIEIDRAGASYAVDTVRLLREIYPGAELIYILGTDAIETLPHWANYAALRQMCRFAYAARGAAGRSDVCAVRIDAALPGISSSDVRARIADGCDARDWIPKDVRTYIASRGLYIADLPEDELIADLKARLKPHRLLHSLGTRDTAVMLMQKNGRMPGKARIAGLLHDCAKYLSDEELLALSDQAGADAAEKENPRLLHAPVGALFARTRYGVRDPEVLSAIRRHTIGGPGMSLLDMIIYLADYIEPNRMVFEGLDVVRTLAQTDIRRAIVECARQVSTYTRGRGGDPHPATARMILELKDGGIVDG